MQELAKEAVVEWRDHTRAMKMAKQLEQKRQEGYPKPKHRAKRHCSESDCVAWVIFGALELGLIVLIKCFNFGFISLYSVQARSSMLGSVEVSSQKKHDNMGQGHWKCQAQ